MQNKYRYFVFFVLLCLNLITVRSQDEHNTVLLIDWSHNETLLALARANLTVEIRRFEDEELIHVLEGHSLQILDLEWSPDDSYLASSDGVGTLIIWDVETGAIITKIESSISELAFLSLAWNNDGTKIAVGTSRNTLEVYDTITGERLQTLFINDQFVTAVDWALDEIIAIGTLSGEILIYRLDTDEVLWEIDDQFPISQINWNSDASLIAVAFNNGQVQILDLDLLTKIRRFQAHDSRIVYIGWDTDSATLITGEVNSLIRVWETTQYTDVTEFSVDIEIYGMDFAPETNIIAYTDETELGISFIDISDALIPFQ